MPRTFERQLPVRLTTAELEERGWSLAEERKKQRSLESAKKAAADDFKERLEANGEEIDRLAGIVHSKCEYRPVQCHEKRDYKRGVIEIVRRDTGEIVETRVMTDAERQRELREIDEEAEAVEQEMAPAASGDVTTTVTVDGDPEASAELTEAVRHPLLEGEAIDFGRRRAKKRQTAAPENA